MNESKMNLEHERKIASLQERVARLEDLCFSAKEVLNLEEASAFLGIAKSILYKMTHTNQLPFFKTFSANSETGVAASGVNGPLI